MTTALVEVEAVLNSRPLTYVAMDDLDEPLTPSHLLTGHRILSLPDNPKLNGNDEDEDEEFSPSGHDQLTRRARHLNRTFLTLSLTHSLTPTHSLSHSLSHSLTPTHPLSHSLTLTLTHSLSHSLTHSLTLSLTPSLTLSLTHTLTHTHPTHSFSSLSPSLQSWLQR